MYVKGGGTIGALVHCIFGKIVDEIMGIRAGREEDADNGELYRALT